MQMLQCAQYAVTTKGKTSFVEPSLAVASENEVHQILLRSPLLNSETCINTYIKDGTEQ